jgi:hypothetical protein
LPPVAPIQKPSEKGTVPKRRLPLEAYHMQRFENNFSIDGMPWREDKLKAVYLILIYCCILLLIIIL